MKQANARQAGPAKASPVIKYLGGKTRLLPELRKRIPPTFGRYYEPFIGGGALCFDLEPERAVIGDINVDLVGLYRALSTDIGVQATIGHLKHFAAEHAAHGSRFYYAVRRAWNQDKGGFPSGPPRAAAMIYLNKTGFNGLWRVNARGKHNVPMGDYANPEILNEEKLWAASAVLARATIRCGNYAETIADAVVSDFVYFDPPYAPVSPTSSFVGYDRDGFGDAAQMLLAEHAALLVDQGVYVMLSNADTPRVREIYRGHPWAIESVTCGRSINSNPSKRGAVGEVIITGGMASWGYGN